ncbi:hypothetical protein NG829_08285 [Xanthomonas sacchari]|uniref:hypothetical protein n=1 Tax=Xanthomonas sacchari TaxID=56458 RepID=UPI00225E4767|nr:hypothetical protein [Xanthomonas sacchari]UYK82273.1 hypothetical protein NG829_08285 [Xanthomonas sacchari]
MSTKITPEALGRSLAAVRAALGLDDQAEIPMRTYDAFVAGWVALQDALGMQAALAEMPRPMDTAPRDGTMLRLLVEFTDHATEDTHGPAWTIGANNFDDSGDDLWQFAGWCWTHDHFTEGKGKPVGWLPLIDSQGKANG